MQVRCREQAEQALRLQPEKPGLLRPAVKTLQRNIFNDMVDCSRRGRPALGRVLRCVEICSFVRLFVRWMGKTQRSLLGG